ncbi:glycoside hydrolase family 88 protein [Aestuariibaculum lutulentum]|uniref:Glycoside hydrolase family 88 protein n=1 Tax=Aestuariibaculum lutulentum TaxID=2920935 RepID=A0ABS9RJI7_9FLAO|nr:glycoside hydrolase family 88 protein [Aestuariibaculum lutulentum]MCH4553113.1 glycoside hydrolase family 88 protein [Aestuariibaculum lutulentum]
MRKSTPFYLVLLFVIYSCGKSNVSIDTKIYETLELSSKQYKFMSQNLPKGRYPKTFENNALETSGSGWWCSGFYPGILLYLDEINENKTFQSEIERVLNDLKVEQYNTSTHDLGFMMFCSFGNAQRLNPNPKYEQILMNSAKSLITRYDKNVKCIRSWDSAPWNKADENDLVVIIDNMMNLELLFWATKHSGDSLYYDIAVEHANKTMKNHFRDDFSSYHEVIYDESTGEVKEQITNQGAADNSSWARGQSWGLYGFTVMYRETKNPKYLKQAEQIANYILNHPNLPLDMVPYWDFNAPNIPNELRDSSAASINASALFELSTFFTGEKQKQFYKAATKILNSLLTPQYLVQDESQGGFLLKHGLGNMPNKTEIDVPLTYGDYYFIEAMVRYKKLKNI